MKSFNFCFVFINVLLFSRVNGQMTLKNLEIGYDKVHRSFHSNHTKQFNNLKLYYIKAKPTLEKEVKGIGNYMNLETAIRQKKIIIKEISSEGNVNSLSFHNISKETIMVQMGDVVKGGKQDRVLENDALIKPGERVELSVYCVEHGRWSRSSRGSAEFNGFHSSINSSIKKTIVKEKNQSSVWDKVAEVNTKNRTTNSTGTYTAVSNSNKFNQDVQSYVNSFIRDIELEKDIVGVLAVTGDRIIGCDIFSTPQLFKTNARNVIHSYATEAVLNGEMVKLSEQKVEDYLSELLDSEEKQERILIENGKSLKMNGKKVKLSAF